MEALVAALIGLLFWALTGVLTGVLTGAFFGVLSGAGVALLAAAGEAEARVCLVTGGGLLGGVSSDSKPAFDATRLAGLLTGVLLTGGLPAPSAGLGVSGRKAGFDWGFEEKNDEMER